MLCVFEHEKRKRRISGGTRIRVVEVEVQGEGKLRELEIDVCRQALRATGWETKAWLPHHKGVLCALILFRCHELQQQEEQ